MTYGAMMLSVPRLGCAIICLAGLAAPATLAAQSAAAPERSVFDGNHLTVGAGAVYGPSYEGSDDYVASVVPVVQGRVAGVEITPRPGGLALDLVPDRRGMKVGFSAGPVVTYSGNRHRQVKDPVVRAAGRLDATIEVGGNAGITVYRVLHGYDSLTMSADIKRDVAGAHGGVVVSPQVSYFTPLSRAAILTLSLSATHADSDHARYYYRVTPAQAAASGLPVYAAKGGWTKLGAGFLAGFDLNGNLLDGGLLLVALGSYSRLQGDARRTPYTALRGDADQWLVGAGIGYTF